MPLELDPPSSGTSSLVLDSPDEGMDLPSSLVLDQPRRKRLPKYSMMEKTAKLEAFKAHQKAASKGGFFDFMTPSPETIDTLSTMVEPYTMAGMLSQPARAFGYADPFQQYTPIVEGEGLLTKPLEALDVATGGRLQLAGPNSPLQGIAEAGEQFAGELTTPAMLPTLPLFAARPAMAAVDLARRVGVGALTGEMALNIPPQLQEAANVYQDPKATLADKTRAATTGILSTLFAIQGGKEIVRPRPTVPWLEETKKRAVQDAGVGGISELHQQYADAVKDLGPRERILGETLTGEERISGTGQPLPSVDVVAEAESRASGHKWDAATIRGEVDRLFNELRDAQTRRSQGRGSRAEEYRIQGEIVKLIGEPTELGNLSRLAEAEMFERSSEANAERLRRMQAQERAMREDTTDVDRIGIADLGEPRETPLPPVPSWQQLPRYVPVAPSSQAATSERIRESVFEQVGPGEGRKALAPGGQISFAADASATGVPSARQAALTPEAARGMPTLPFPEDLYGPKFDDFLRQVGESRDTTALNDARQRWIKQPRSERTTTALEAIDKRLQEIREGKMYPKPKPSPWPKPSPFPPIEIPGTETTTHHPVDGVTGSMGRARDVLARIAANVKSKYRDLAQAVIDTGDAAGLDVEVLMDVHNEVSPIAAAHYSPRKDVIQFRKGYADRDEYHIHEIIHALTNRKLNNEIVGSYKQPITHGRALDAYLKDGKNKVVKELINMYKDLQKKVDSKDAGQYGLTDFQEFLAEGFSNPKFQAAMAQIKDTVTNKTYWQKFVDIIKKLTGLKVEDTMLEKFIREGGHFLKEERPAEPHDVQSRLNVERPKPSEMSPELVEDRPRTIGEGIKDAVKRNREAGNIYIPSKADIQRNVQGFLNWKGGRALRPEIGAQWDAVINRAKTDARMVANRLKDSFKVSFRRPMTNKDQRALALVVEAGGDIANLRNFRNRLNALGQADLVKAADEGITHWGRYNSLAQTYADISSRQVTLENNFDVMTDFRKNYVPHIADMRDINATMFESVHRGGASGFTKQRVFDNFVDALEQGIKYKSYDAVDLLEHRMATGLEHVYRNQMINEMKNVTDPRSGQPIIQNIRQVKKVGPTHADTQSVVPPGYQSVNLGGMQNVAVHNNFAALFKALNSESAYSTSALGRGAMQTATTLKHSVLLFDTFHPMRLAFWSLGTSPKGLANWKKGLSLLEYDDTTINRMVRDGELPPAYAQYARENRYITNLALRSGYNVARFHDNLYTELLRKIPGIGRYNKWLFEKYQRGLMLGVYINEFKRMRDLNPGMDDVAVSKKVSKDLNIRYGNLMSQSVIKNKTLSDTLRLVFLAPQWNEGLIRSELKTYKELGQLPGELIKHKGRTMGGTFAKNFTTVTAGYFVINQIVNQMTRGQFTWENDDEEPGAKVSAYVPDWGGESEGFLMNPLALTAEIGHQIQSQAEKSGSLEQGIRNVLEYKLGPVGKAGLTYVTKQDWRDVPLEGGELWSAVGEAITPKPIPYPVVKSIAEVGVSKLRGTEEPFKEAYPGATHKQAFAMFGVKLDKLKKPYDQKADEEAIKQTGQSLATLSLEDRVPIYKALNEKRTPRDLMSDYASEVRAAAIQHKLKKDLYESMPVNQRNWLEANQLKLPAYETSITRDSTRVPMQRNEQEAFSELVSAGYQQVIDDLKMDPVFQEMSRLEKQDELNKELSRARRDAMDMLDEMITSGSIIERDKAKRKRLFDVIPR